MVDLEILTQALRQKGHVVEHIINVPANAGDIELTVDGEVLNLAEARQLLADEQPK